mmetsp:Transcript_30580/g.30063  ORF Transcript_30580/g.30063 Transcript_30580/m.30063 type:complete len:327 (-) Transcript_30580:129-1109(-)
MSKYADNWASEFITCIFKFFFDYTLFGLPLASFSNKNGATSRSCFLLFILLFITWSNFALFLRLRNFWFCISGKLFSTFWHLFNFDLWSRGCIILKFDLVFNNIFIIKHFPVVNYQIFINLFGFLVFCCLLEIGWIFFKTRLDIMLRLFNLFLLLLLFFFFIVFLLFIIMLIFLALASFLLGVYNSLLRSLFFLCKSIFINEPLSDELSSSFFLSLLFLSFLLAKPLSFFLEFTDFFDSFSFYALGFLFDFSFFFFLFPLDFQGFLLQTLFFSFLSFFSLSLFCKLLFDVACYTSWRTFLLAFSFSLSFGTSFCSRSLFSIFFSLV